MPYTTWCGEKTGSDGKEDDDENDGEKTGFHKE